MHNLTPSEIAEIEEKAEKEASLHYNRRYSPDNWQSCVSCYTAAACEYAAEIKRLREGIESPVWFARWKDENYFTIKVNDINCYLPKVTRKTEIYLSIDKVYETFKQLLNNQP